MSATDFDEDDRLLEASRQAYKSSTGRSSQSHESSEAFTDGTDLVTFDTEIPQARKTSRPSKSEKSTKRKPVSEAPEVSSSLDAIEQKGVVNTKKPSKRQIQEVRDIDSLSIVPKQRAPAGSTCRLSQELTIRRRTLAQKQASPATQEAMPGLRPRRKCGAR